MRNIQTTIQKIVIIALAVGISQSAIAENFCPNNAQRLADAWGASVDDINKALTDDQLMFHFAQYSPENDPSITEEVAFQYCFSFERNMLEKRAMAFWEEVRGKFSAEEYKSIKTKLEDTIQNAKANSEEAKQLATLGLAKEEQKMEVLKAYISDELKSKAAETAKQTQADLKKADAKVTETKDSVTAAVKKGEGDLKNLYDKCAGKGDVSGDAAAVYAAQMQAANGDENARQEMFGKQASPVPPKKLDGNAPPAPKSDADSSGGFSLWGRLKSLGSKIADGAKAVGNSIANTWTQMSHDHPILTSFLVGAAAAAAAAAIFVSVAGVPVVGSALAAYYTITWMGTFGIASGLTYAVITAPKSVKTAPSAIAAPVQMNDQDQKTGSMTTQPSAPTAQTPAAASAASAQSPIASGPTGTTTPPAFPAATVTPAQSGQNQPTAAATDLTRAKATKSVDNFHLAHRNPPAGISREYSTFLTNWEPNSALGTYTGLVNGYYNQAGTMKPKRVLELAKALAKFNSGPNADPNKVRSYKTIYIPADPGELIQATYCPAGLQAIPTSDPYVLYHCESAKK